MADNTHTKDLDKGTCELCNANPCLCVVSIRNKIPKDNQDVDVGIVRDVDLEHIRRGSR